MSSRLLQATVAVVVGALVAVGVTTALQRTHVAEALVVTDAGAPRDEYQSVVLAKQYSRLAPDDNRVLAAMSRATGFSMGDAGRRLALQAGDHLPLITLQFRAPDRRRALAGARAAVTAMTAPGGAAPGSSLVEQVVMKPRSALERYLGVALGLLAAMSLGLGLGRRRPRLRRPASLLGGFDGPVLAVPADGVGQAIASHVGGALQTQVIAPDPKMRDELSGRVAAGADDRVSLHGDLAPQAPPASVVLVLRRGCRLDEALAALRRLCDLGAAPRLVLIVGGHRHELAVSETAVRA